MRKQYTRASMEQKISEILQLATSKRMLDELRAVLETPQAEQLAEASKRLSIDSLGLKGLSLPTNTRISSRVFDEATGQSTVLGSNPSAMMLHYELPKGGLTTIKPEDLIDKKSKNQLIEEAIKNGWSLCLCVGAGGCVGVGGGT